MAMYEAKKSGRSGYYFYDKTIGDRLSRNVLIETRLRVALDEKSLELYFQPKVDLLSQKCIGLEALLRWNDAELGDVSPVEFIPVAESCGLIIPLGEWVFDQSCSHIKQWHDAGEVVPTVAINCSAAQLKRDDFLSGLISCLDKYNVQPDKIELEVTESILIEDLDSCAELLKQVSHLGMNIAIDDFGTGYSGLSYLKDLPFNSIKIDQVFVRDMLINENHLALTKAIIQMSHALNLKVVAEGITSTAQMDKLIEFGCDIGQGYLFGKAFHADLVVSKIDS
jgi:EAL domain-containing protein (putative c-di-GMP-specific phosphodiesterase class I)